MTDLIDTNDTTTITAAEYAARRQRVLDALISDEAAPAAAVVFAGEGSHPLLGHWRPDRYFLHLTGIDSEPGAAVLFDPSAEDPDRRIILFLRPINPEVDQWDGFRPQLGEALKTQLGFGHVLRTSALPSALTAAAKRIKRFACLHPFATYPAALSPDLAVYRQVSERVPGVAIEDRTRLLPEMRSLKSPAEIALIRRAVAATVAGYAAAIPQIRPGSTERAVALALENGYREHGGEHAFNPIVGTAGNAAVLHYMANNAPLNDGELVLIDSGAAFGGYAADVTRTYPVSGRFTAEQRRLYDLVHAAHQAAIAVAKPGAKMYEVDRAARTVLAEGGFPDGFPYVIGHPLGLDVHDVSAGGELQAGMVLTIEPGLYLPEQNIGIRIEDDILLTENGNENLTAAIPRSIEEIEAAFAA